MSRMPVTNSPAALTLLEQPEVRLVGDRLVVRAPYMFGDDNDANARRFLERAFSLPEVRKAVVRRERGLIDLVVDPLADPSHVWKRLGALLRQPLTAKIAGLVRADRIPLQSPAVGLPVRVNRAGRGLTTFQVRAVSSGWLRIGHPLLRRRDVRGRLTTLLRSTYGVEDVRVAGVFASVLVVYDSRLIKPDQLLRILDDSWSFLLQGPPVAPPTKKLFIAGALVALSFTGQFLRPALRPWATAAVALYALPNAIRAIRDLRHGQVGVPAMASVSLGFLLWTGMPFASSVMATFAQLWPALANGLAARIEHRLFAEHHRRLTWARLAIATDVKHRIDLADLRPGTTVLARKGDIIPVDGSILEGFAAIEERILTGARGAIDRTVGDKVFAGTLVRDGAIAVRVERVGAATSAAALSRALPHGAVSGLPSTTEAEHVANRNAKPALLLAGLFLLATRTPRLSQVAIRPDYASAPRLSSHLSALRAIVESLEAGALVRSPSSLDRLLSVDVCVLDDGIDFARRGVQVEDVKSGSWTVGAEALALAAAALAEGDDQRGSALKRESERGRSIVLRPREAHRIAGATLFVDESGSLITVATPDFALRNLRTPPSDVLNLLRAEAGAIGSDPATRALAVARGRDILGVIRFDRSGPLLVADAVSALRRQTPDVQFLHLSSSPQDVAETRTDLIGLDAVFGGLDLSSKIDAMRSISSNAIWIGDGGDLKSAPARAAAAVSVSIAGVDALPRDMSDIVLLRGDLASLVVARRSAEHRFARLKDDYRVVYLANLAALAGGVGAGFGSLRAGLTSNLGSAAVFLSHWRSLNRLAARTERETEGGNRMFAPARIALGSPAALADVE
jgi:cation transport ATPase